MQGGSELSSAQDTAGDAGNLKAGAREGQEGGSGAGQQVWELLTQNKGVNVWFRNGDSHGHFPILLVTLCGKALSIYIQAYSTNSYSQTGFPLVL